MSDTPLVIHICNACGSTDVLTRDMVNRYEPAGKLTCAGCAYFYTDKAAWPCLACTVPES